jgi:hypothetical protein
MNNRIRRNIFLAALFCLQSSLGFGHARQVTNDFGITQQDDPAMQWFMDAKFGMFLHWGIYAASGRGEWFFEKDAMPLAQYQKYATNQGDGVYFDAKDYKPAEWAKIAKDSGMKYLCLTARHHDGFALFDSRHPNAFTSVQTLHRDLYAEYVHSLPFCGPAGRPLLLTDQLALSGLLRCLGHQLFAEQMELPDRSRRTRKTRA